MNAGGVTVSYLEWVKNVSHIRFGRLDRRLEEARGQQIIKVIEAMTGRTVPAEIRRAATQGLWRTRARQVWTRRYDAQRLQRHARGETFSHERAG